MKTRIRRLFLSTIACTLTISSVSFGDSSEVISILEESKAQRVKLAETYISQIQMAKTRIGEIQRQLDDQKVVCENDISNTDRSSRASFKIMATSGLITAISIWGLKANWISRGYVVKGASVGLNVLSTLGVAGGSLATAVSGVNALQFKCSELGPLENDMKAALANLDYVSSQFARNIL